MEAKTLLEISACAVAVAGLAGWRGARPPNPLKGPRMIPWRFIMVVAAATALGFLFQAARSAGIHPPGR